MNKYLFSYIIGYRYRPDNVNLLKKTLEWLSGFNGIEIILIEQDRHPKIKYNDLKGCKYHFCKSDKPFNKSWAFNVGIKYASTNRLVFGDCDTIMIPEDLIAGLKKLEEYEAVNPYNKLINMETQDIMLPVKEFKTVNNRENNTMPTNFCGGIVMFTREGINKCAGWDVNFYGFGGEDDFQTNKIQKLELKSIELDAFCYHLYHPRYAPDPNYYNRNVDLLFNKLNPLNADQLKNYLNRSAANGSSKNMLNPVGF